MNLWGNFFWFGYFLTTISVKKFDDESKMLKKQKLSSLHLSVYLLTFAKSNGSHPIAIENIKIAANISKNSYKFLADNSVISISSRVIKYYIYVKIDTNINWNSNQIQ